MWGLKDKDGLFRSRNAFKKDCKHDSSEDWEIRRKNQNSTFDNLSDAMTFAKAKHEHFDILELDKGWKIKPKKQGARQVIYQR